MGLSPRIVTETRYITWDGVIQRLPRGQVMDVPPDSPLEREIGRQFLVPLPGTVPQDPAPEAVRGTGGGGGAPGAPGATRPAPAKPRATAKQDDGKDGDP